MARENVFLFVPQLIGYTRIICLFAAFYNIDKWYIFLMLYCVSFGLDVIDGPVARYFGQATYFGAALDMLTDKFSTPGILAVLAQQHYAYRHVFICLMVLDITSHYFHVYSTLLRGFHSHKQTDRAQNAVVRLFYGSKAFFTFTCIGHEVFIIALYVCNYETGASFYSAPTPDFIITTMVLAGIPISREIGLVQMVVLATLLSFVTKSVVHVAQLLSACEGIATHDMKEREKRNQSKPKQK